MMGKEEEGSHCWVCHNTAQEKSGGERRCFLQDPRNTVCAKQQLVCNQIIIIYILGYRNAQEGHIATLGEELLNDEDVGKMVRKSSLRVHCHPAPKSNPDTRWERRLGYGFLLIQTACPNSINCLCRLPSTNWQQSAKRQTVLCSNPLSHSNSLYTIRYFPVW